MRKDFVFKFGKHAGKTYEWVEENNPSYIVWAEESAPNLLKESKPKPKPVEQKTITFSDAKSTTMSPNLNFWNEGPSSLSKPYLDKMKESLVEVKTEQKNTLGDDEWNF